MKRNVWRICPFTYFSNGSIMYLFIGLIWNGNHKAHIRNMNVNVLLRGKILRCYFQTRFPNTFKHDITSVNIYIYKFIINRPPKNPTHFCSFYHTKFAILYWITNRSHFITKPCIDKKAYDFVECFTEVFFFFIKRNIYIHVLYNIRSLENRNMSIIIGLFQQRRSYFLTANDKLPDQITN